MILTRAMNAVLSVKIFLVKIGKPDLSNKFKNDGSVKNERPALSNPTYYSVTIDCNFFGAFNPMIYWTGQSTKGFVKFNNIGSRTLIQIIIVFYESCPNSFQ